MDPNATLRVIAEAEYGSDEMLSSIEELHEWLRHGNAPPDWKACPGGTERYDQHFATLEIT